MVGAARWSSRSRASLRFCAPGPRLRRRFDSLVSLFGPQPLARVRLVETIACIILLIGSFVVYAAAGQLRGQAARGTSEASGDPAEPRTQVRDERDMVEDLRADAPVGAVPLVTAASERESVGHADQITVDS